MADAPIDIVEYRPEWPLEFAHEQQFVSQALAPWLVGLPQHIGSTAVPGLAAKPIIDIMAAVASLEESTGAVAAAERIGYVYFPYKQEVMHWFCKPLSGASNPSSSSRTYGKSALARALGVSERSPCQRRPLP